MRKNINIREGQILGIPVSGELIFPALVTRKDSCSFLLYIFRPLYPGQQFREIQRDKVMMVALCSGDVNEESRWRTLSTDLSFSKDTWPVPVIATFDEPEKKHYALMYTDDLKMEFRLRVSGEVAKRMQGSGIYCSESLEKKLAQWMNTDFQVMGNDYPAIPVVSTAEPGFVR